MHGIRSLPLRAPYVTLAILFSLTCFFGFFARLIRVDSSIENLLPVDDPEKLYYDRIKATFGDEEIVVIGVFADDIFAPSTIAKIDKLTKQLTAGEGVREVVSVTNVEGAEMTDEGLTIGPLMRKLPETPAEGQALRARIIENPLYVKNVVSADGKAAAISIVFQEMTDDEFLRSGTEERIRALLREYSGPERFAVTGMPIAKASATRMMESDILTFTPLAALLVTLVLLFAFRTPRGILIPLCTVAIGVIWTSGAMVLTDTPINMGTLVLNPLLMVVGAASGIHLISEYYLEVKPGRSAREIVERSLARVSVPIVTAAATTLIGFGTLIFTPIRAVREFGIYSVFGIVAVVIAAFTVVPAALSVLPVPTRSVLSDGEDRGWLSRALRRLTAFVCRHRWPTLIAAGAVILLSIWGVSRIRVETDYLGFFDADSSIRVENDLISKSLAGTQAIYIVVDGTEAGTVTQLETMRALAELQKFVVAQPGVDLALSLVDYLTIMRRVLQPDTAPGLPETQGELNQLLMLVDQKQIKPVLNSERTLANLVVRTSLSRSVEVSEFVARVREFAASHFPRGVVVRPTGTVVLLSQSADELAWGQITGLWQELSVLLLLLSIMFLSLRVGVLALIPNVVPTVILFGLMGWLQIDLNICTSMIAAIAIGIAIDDTIHLLSRFNEELRHTGSQEQAIINAVGSVGQSAFFIALALSAGFFIVCLSNFQPVRHFGLLSGATMGIALVVELFLTPALVTTTKIATIWDFLFLKLGPEPHRQIPLFKDMWSFQAKLVVLMGRLRSARRGELIARLGDLSPELYVFLNGRAEVYRDDPSRVLRQIRRGDVVGEMGLVRTLPRSANVVAVEDTDYLVLDARHLERMQRRYPRIAAMVYLNLARVLSDRLETTTVALSAAAAQAATEGKSSSPSS